MTTTPYDDPGFAAELGRTIRLLRVDRDIDRKDLADEAGISYSYLSAIENGTKTPSARLLYSLAQAFGLRDDELLAMARDRIAPSTTAPPAATTALTSLAPPPMAAAAAAPPPAPAGGPRLFRRARAAPEPATPPAEERAEELAELLARLDPDDAQAVLDLARRLARDR